MADERRLTSQGQERKEQLLQHAARLFAEHGYDDTRIIDICKAAGVAKGLFYWYFENKEQLFAELAHDIRLRLRRCQSDAMDPAADPLTRIRQGSEASVRFMADNARFFSLLEVESLFSRGADAPDPGRKKLVGVLREGTDVHVADVRTLVDAGIALGQIRDDDPILLARGVVGTVGIYGHFHRTGRSPVPVDELAAFVGRFVVSSLAADDQIALAALPTISATGVARY